MESIPIHNPFPGAACFLFASTESTQSEARRLADMGFPPGSLVAADAQTAGRGRFPGRKWESEVGKNLLFTLFLDPASAGLPGLPIRIGTALCVAMTVYALRNSLSYPRPLRLKWPNDLMIADRKVAGILCEAGPSGVFAGIGLNCNQVAFPDEIKSTATSLAMELGCEVSRWELLELFLDRLHDSLRDENWRSSAEALLWKRGEHSVFLPGREGSPFRPSPFALAGRVVGIDEAGSLLFRTEGAAFAESYAAGELRAVVLS